MNTEQINRFDELMREKLGSYEETEPDMDLLVHIHARKNRFLRLRNLYTLIVILAIVSAGIVGGYYFLGDNQSKQQSPVNPKEQSIHATSTLHGTKRDLSTKMNNETKAQTGSVVDGKRSPIRTNKNNFVNSKNNSKSSYNNYINRQDLPETKDILNQATLNQVNESKQDINKSTQTKNTTSIYKVEPTAKADYNNNKDNTKQIADACKVEIDYYTSYDNGFNFIARSQNPNIQITWLFGDGKSSHEQSPKHVYQKAGQYAVTLTAIDKKTKCKAETYTLVQVKQGVNLTSSTISGTVFADAEYATKTRVDLLVYNTTNNVYERVQSAFTNNKGFYEFNEIVEGNYLIKANDFKDYTASYYGNTTDREYANSVVIFANDYKELSGYDIQLTNHRLNAVNNRNNSDTGSSRWMLVFDQNNNPVASVLVNAEGKIQSSVNLPDGNYNLMDPSTGKSTGKLNVGADGIRIGTPDINTGKASGLAPEPLKELVLMPNPATDYVKVSLNPFNSQPIHVKIVNSQGALVQSLTLENGNDVNNINISALPVGTYYVVVNQNGVTTSNRLVKTIDSSK
jgi:hypothetical protein